jgi:hypothetical protein
LNSQPAANRHGLVDVEPVEGEPDSVVRSLSDVERAWPMALASCCSYPHPYGAESQIRVAFSTDCPDRAAPLGCEQRQQRWGQHTVTAWDQRPDVRERVRRIELDFAPLTLFPIRRVHGGAEPLKTGEERRQVT